MGTLYWVGGTNGNWQTAANWSTAAIPVDGDDVIFDNGSVSVDAGLTGHAAGNDQLNSLTINPNYNGSIGSAATALTLAGGVTTFKCAGRGAFYKVSFTSTTARIDTTSSQTVYVSGGTWTNTYHSGTGGELNVESAAVLTNYYGTNRQVRLVAASGTAFTIVKTAGYCKSVRSIGTYTQVAPSVLLMLESAAITTSANLVASGIYEHNSSGTIAILDAVPHSSFPCATSRRDFTITQLNEWQDSKINKNPAAATVTISATTQFGYSSASTFGSGGAMGLP